MDLTLRLRAVGYSMRCYEARVWLNLAKVRYTIGPHLYFSLILFRRISKVGLYVKRDFIRKGTNMSKTWLRPKLRVLWWLAQRYSHARLNDIGVFFPESYQ